MKLLPAVIFVIIIFLAGLLFLQGRHAARRPGGFPGAWSSPVRKAAFFTAAIALLALFGILFMFLGKIAFLIALITLALFFLTAKKGS